MSQRRAGALSERPIDYSLVHGCLRETSVVKVFPRRKAGNLEFLVAAVSFQLFEHAVAPNVCVREQVGFRPCSQIATSPLDRHHVSRLVARTAERLRSLK